jgi:hypothetical protein
MIRSLGMSIALLTIVLLMSAGSASARTGGTIVSTPVSATQINAIASAVNPFQILNARTRIMYLDGNDGHPGHHYANNDGGDKDKDKDNDDKAPAPEPSTILSFGAALLIGGGVLYSRRLRASKK